MPNLLYIYPKKMPSTELMYESADTAENREKGIFVRFRIAEKVKDEDLAWADAVIGIRDQSLLAQWILVRAKKIGLRIIQNYDDDIMALSYEQVEKVSSLPWRKKAVMEGFAHTDFISCANAMLGEKYARYIPSDRYFQSESSVDPSELIPPSEVESRSDDGVVKIVYAAGRAHEPMFDKYIAPVMQDLIDRYGRKISMSFFGVHPDLSKYSGMIDIQYVGALPLEEYRAAVKNGCFDIGLAPLESDEFTQYKYYNKFVEYTISGIAGIYSNVLPYTLVVKDGENGILADNTAEGWCKALCSAIDDPSLRHRCYKNAYETALTRFDANTKKKE